MPLLNRCRWCYSAATALLLLALAACSSKPPANVAAMVNNRAITNEELEKNFQSRPERSAMNRGKASRVRNRRKMTTRS